MYIGFSIKVGVDDDVIVSPLQSLSICMGVSSVWQSEQMGEATIFFLCGVALYGILFNANSHRKVFTFCKV